MGSGYLRQHLFKLRFTFTMTTDSHFQTRHSIFQQFIRNQLNFIIVPGNMVTNLFKYAHYLLFAQILSKI